MTQSPDEQQSWRIAVVDDEPRIREMVSAVLTDAGVVEELQSFEEPMALLEHLKESESPPDIVLLDVHFENSGLSGIEILPFIREDHPYLPVILLTGMEGDEIMEAQDFEYTYYIPKPVNPDQLIRMVKFYLGKGRKSAARMAEIEQNLDEHRELLDYLEDELAQAKEAGTVAPLSGKQAKAFERVVEILNMVLRTCELMPSFVADLERVYLSDFKLVKKAVDALIRFDVADSLSHGLNIHKYEDMIVENVYSLRLSRKARIFFYRSPLTSKRRLLRLDQDHDTQRLIRWCRANYDTYGDDL